MPELPLKFSEFLKPVAEMASSMKEMAKGTPLEMLAAPIEMAYAPLRDTLKEQGLDAPESAPLPGELEYYMAKNFEEGKMPVPAPEMFLPFGQTESKGSEKSLGEVEKVETRKREGKRYKFEVKVA